MVSLTDTRHIIVAMATTAFLIIRVYIARNAMREAREKKAAASPAASRRDKIIDAVLLLVAAPIAGGAFFYYAAGQYLTSFSLAALAILVWAQSWRSWLKE